MKKTYALPILLAAALLATACGNGDSKTPGATAPAGGMPPPPEVDVITVSVGSATLTQDLPGRLQAVRSAQVRARVEGVLEKRLYKEGSDIAAGTPLFQIDARTYQAAAAAAAPPQAAAPAPREPENPQRGTPAGRQPE